MSLITLFKALNFKKLPLSNVVIIHSNDFLIKKYILREIGSITLSIYPEPHSLYINCELLNSFLNAANFVKFIKLIFSKSETNIVKYLYVNYLIECLNIMGAKVAITYIDNSSIFQSLDLNDNLSGRVYLAVQNGTRTLSCVGVPNRVSRNEDPKIFLSNFYCFGYRDVDLYKMHAHNVLNYYPLGSILGSEYGKSIKTGDPKKFDICYISQWQEYFERSSEYLNAFVSNGTKVRDSIVLLNELIKRAVEGSELKLIIAMRTSDPLEENFYYRVFGDMVEYRRFDHGRLTSFQAVNESRLVIAMNSTMLAQVFSWGTKVLWCNTINDEIFAMPEAGICYYAGNDFDQFLSKIKSLIDMSEEDFIKITSLNAVYINNPLKSVGDLVRERIMHILKC